MKEFVICKVKGCGRQLKIINNDHLRTHNITLDEYKEMFGTKDLVSEKTSNGLAVMRGKKRPEHSKRMSGKNNPMYGGHSKETKEKISRNRKDKGIGVSGKYKRTNEIRNKISKSVAQRHLEGRYNNHTTGGYYISKKTGRKCYYRSSWEKIVMEYLDNHNLVSSWVYEPFTVSYNDEYGFPHHYTPDFYVLISDCIKEIWEVKPKFRIDDRVRCKLNGVSSEFSVRIITEDEIETIKNNREWVVERYGKSEY